MKASEYKISLDKFPRDRNEEKGLSQVYGQASLFLLVNSSINQKANRN
jgi:hypothetical protein